MAKVVAGFLSFTEVTDPSQHRAYNAWHQLDHLPEQLPLPGIVHGQRWVLSPRCRARAATLSPPFDRIHYVTLYLLAAPLDETLRDFAALAERLRAAGRFFEHRRSHLSGPFAVTAAHAAPRVLVSAEAVPYRPHLGVHVTVEALADVAGQDTASVAGQDTASVEVLTGLDGVAGAWTFRSSPTASGPWRPGDHRVTVSFVDADPVAVAPAIEHVLADRAPRSAPVLAAPFEVITPWQWDWFDR